MKIRLEETAITESDKSFNRGPHYRRVGLILGNQIYIPKDACTCPPQPADPVAAFQNPDFTIAGHAAPTYDKPRIMPVRGSPKHVDCRAVAWMKPVKLCRI